ncbi:MAG: isoaspartyl peptidase/L-asparaginase [Tannerellaceae bacterium]|nr:isoaspartyl peptidase/L-asparaginase [Tannerellaceae bacterium]
MQKISILLVAVLLSTATVVKGQNRDYTMAIHGGAGNVSQIENEPERAKLYYASLDSALMIGNNLLASGADGVEAVIAVLNYLENNPLFNAGKGATCTLEGTFELDAAIMEGKDLSAGAVAGVRIVKNPINAAYAVKQQTSHVLLSGTGAEAFAQEEGLELVDNMYFATPKTMEWIEQVKRESEKNGTVGCVVLDTKGNLTAGTSTGGMFKKRWGRIGDAPLIGAGTYADNNSCAISCTGHGEYFIRHAVAFHVCARYKYLGESLEEAAHHMIYQELNAEAGNGGLIAVGKEGNITLPFNSSGMSRGYVYKDSGQSDIIKGIGIGEKIISSF